MSTRACYLFARLAKSLRSSLVRFVPDILSSLQSQLAGIAAQPLPEADPAAASRAVLAKGPGAFPGAADDR